MHCLILSYDSYHDVIVGIALVNYLKRNYGSLDEKIQKDVSVLG